jgi:hypothetical protein
MMKALGIQLLIALLLLGSLPFAIAYRFRSAESRTPRIHLVLDMDKQDRYNAQSRNLLFADQRAMRPRIEGTIAREDPIGDEHLNRGLQDGNWATELPMPVTRDFIDRGRQRYNINCAACHGYSGYGNGMIAKRAEELAEGTWTVPSSLHEDSVRGQPPGQLFNSISRGVRNMPAMSQQITVEDRWAIVAYIQALQRSQNASAEDIPAGELESLLSGTEESQP